MSSVFSRGSWLAALLVAWTAGASARGAGAVRKVTASDAVDLRFLD